MRQAIEKFKIPANFNNIKNRKWLPFQNIKDNQNKNLKAKKWVRIC